MADNKFLNSIFITKKEGVGKNGQPYSFQKMGVKIEELIKELRALTPDSNGFCNFTINSHLKDPSKFSVMLDTFVPTQQPTVPGQVPSTPKKSDSSDLPF